MGFLLRAVLIILVLRASSLATLNVPLSSGSSSFSQLSWFNSDVALLFAAI